MTSTSTTKAERERMDQRLSDALAALWRAIRARHPELLAAAPIVASPVRPAGWLDGALTARYPRSNALRDGAAATLAALLREAAHELGESRAINTTSRGGYYHTRKFAELAEELGLEVAEDGTRGWSQVWVPETTAAIYTEPVEQLAAALTAYPRPSADRPQRGGRKISLYCGCDPSPGPITVSAKRADHGGIRCDVCGQVFAPKAV